MQPPAMPPAGRPGVDIGGRRLPRSQVLVFLHIGHSNMAGRATRPTELRPLFYDTDPRLWTYGDGGFAPAKEPTAPDNQNGQAAGPGMALLRGGDDRGPAGHRRGLALDTGTREPTAASAPRSGVAGCCTRSP